MEARNGVRLASVCAIALGCPFDSTGVLGGVASTVAVDTTATGSGSGDQTSAPSSGSVNGTDDSAESSSSTGVTTGCGNSVVEGDELCDDGDQEQGDGCNPDCRPSGSLEWSVLYDGPDTTRIDRAIDIAWHRSGSVLAVGVRDDGTVNQKMLLVARAADTGESLWSDVVGPFGRTAAAVAFAPTGDAFYIAGFSGADEDTQGKVFAYPYAASRQPGHALWNVAFGSETAGVRDEAHGIAVMSDGTIVVGGVVCDGRGVRDARRAARSARRQRARGVVLDRRQSRRRHRLRARPDTRRDRMPRRLER